MGTDDDIELGGYPAKWCPRRTPHDYSPDSPEPLDESPEQRLRAVIDQARMTRDGIDIEPLDPATR